MLGNWLLKKCLTNAQKNGMLRAAYRLSTGKRKKPAEAGLILNLTIVRFEPARSSVRRVLYRKPQAIRQASIV